MKKEIITQTKISLQRHMYILVALVFTALTMLSLIPTQKAQAVPLSTRSLTMGNNSTTAATATTVYTFSLLAPTGANTGLRGIEVNFCTTALFGSCAAPTGMSVTSATIGTTSPVSGGTLTSNNTGTPNSALASSGTAAQVRFQWASNQTLSLPQTVTFIFNAIQNPTTAGTFFARVGFFGNGDTTYTTVTDSAVIAQSVQIVQNVSFKVQETLSFCVGAMPNATVAFAGFAAATLTDSCAQSAGTSISLGIAPDSTTTCLSPSSVRSATCDDTGTTDDNNYGYAMVRTNAAGGAAVGYRPNSSTNFTQGTLQTSAASGCTFTVRTDNCINPVNEDAAIAVNNVAPWLVTSSTEQFGMAVPAKNNTTRATNVLNRVTSSTGYGFTGNISGGVPCTTGAASTQDCWNWSRTGSANLATSSSAIDNEAIQIFFATKAAITSPSGAYAVNVDYYANPTF